MSGQGACSQKALFAAAEKEESGKLEQGLMSPAGIVIKPFDLSGSTLGIIIWS